MYFKFFVGFDKADEIYDTGDSWADFRAEFRRRAVYRMSEQLIEADEISLILKKRLALRLQHFEHLGGAPSQVGSAAVDAAPRPKEWMHTLLRPAVLIGGSDAVYPCIVGGKPAGPARAPGGLRLLLPGASPFRSVTPRSYLFCWNCLVDSCLPPRQVNDDTVIVTPNWPPKLVACLASNPLLPNLGVTGPLDSNNDKIFTHR